MNQAAGCIWLGRSEPNYRDCADERADEMAEQQAEAEQSPGCCGHGNYAFLLVNGMRHARCQRCAHTWLVVLGDGDTDYLAADIPGIALR